MRGAFKGSGIEAERQYYVAERSIRYCLDFAVFCERGGVDVECDGDTWHIRPEAAVEDNVRNNFLTGLGWSVLRYSSRELSEQAMPKTLDSVRHTVNRLGGLVTANNVNRRFRPGSSEIMQQLRLW